MAPRSVTILDLGLGNLHSVARAFERAGASTSITTDPDAVRKAARVVVPGQGAIRQCSLALAGDFGEALRETIAKGTPYFGICLGMQCLFERSEEAKDVLGMGLFRGEVTRFSRELADASGARLKVPHMGWNAVQTRHPLLDDGGYYYFVHSFKCEPADPSLTVATADYGGPFCAAIAKDNVFACQFHPEKSHRKGAKLLERFLETT